MTWRARGVPGFAQFAPGLVVRGSHNAELAESLNATRSVGGVLVPMTGIKGAVIASTTRTVRMQVLSRSAAKRRVWTLSPVVDTDGIAALTFTDPQGVASAMSVSGMVVRDAQSHQFVETITSPVNGPVAISFTLASAAGAKSTRGPMVVGCHEVVLDSDREAAMQALSVGTGMPIYDTSGRSLGGLADLHDAIWQMTGRTLFQHLTFGGSDAYATNSASYVTLVGKTPCLVPKARATETTRAMTIYAYTRSDAATTGTLRFTTDVSLSTATIAIPAGDTGTWRSTTLLVHTEDVSTADGWRGGGPDSVTCEGIRNSGAGSIYADSFSGLDVR